jgi:excisionase family DNA binding protein
MATPAPPYTRKQAAARLSISVETLDRAIKGGHLRACRIARRVLVTEQACQDFLAHCEGVVAER